MSFPKPDLGTPVLITDNQELPSEVEPFIIDAWAMSFVGDEFLAMDGKVFRVRSDTGGAKGGAWGEFPLEIKLKECGLPEGYVAVRFVGNTIKDGLGLPITVTKMQDCVACVRLAKADQCMVGTWQLNRDDHLSWLQKQAVDMADVRFSSVGGDIFLKLDANGTAQWIMDGFQIGAVCEPTELADHEVSIEIDVRADAVLDGEWSTDGAGAMNSCGMGAAGDYISKVRVPGLDEDEVALAAPVEDMFLTYTCSATKATMAYMGPAPLPGDFPAWRLDRVK